MRVQGEPRMSSHMARQEVIDQAANFIAQADALLVTAGAGMSVDSGLPDFRSVDGFWRQYPALRPLGLSFEQIAQPHWFNYAPAMAWAWYGHRQELYRAAEPHRGYQHLKTWGDAMPAGYFVVTSNVDSQFQKASFSPIRILEIHGNIFQLQCTVPCRDFVWQDSALDLKIDVESLRADGKLPHCPECGALARPNIMMFNDGTWVSAYRDKQEPEFNGWLSAINGKRLVVIECGAGTAIAKIRRLAESLGSMPGCVHIRVNPDGIGGDDVATLLKLPALQALTAIERALPAAFRQRCLQEAERRAANRTSTNVFDFMAERAKSDPGGVISTVPCDDLHHIKSTKAYSKAFQVKLKSGWTAWVDQIDVKRTYGGLLEGLPDKSMADKEIRDAIAFVNASFHGPEPVVITPKLFDAHSATPVMPPLRFAAQIRAWQPLNDEDDGSWMNLIWFAEVDDNKPLKAFVEEALAQIDWQSKAEGYEV